MELFINITPTFELSCQTLNSFASGCEIISSIVVDTHIIALNNRKFTWHDELIVNSHVLEALKHLHYVVNFEIWIRGWKSSRWWRKIAHVLYVHDTHTHTHRKPIQRLVAYPSMNIWYFNKSYLLFITWILDVFGFMTNFRLMIYLCKWKYIAKTVNTVR